MDNHNLSSDEFHQTYTVDEFEVKNFILLADDHKSRCFLSWKEQGAQLSLLAKDLGFFDCLATEFLIDRNTLSLMVSDKQKNIQVELTGCRGIWTVYHKSTCSRNADLSKVTDDDEYHAYLIITLEARTMVLETADLLTEVTESVDYYVQGRTIATARKFV
ncbi:hypothetical protein QUC31_008027 [Theobroma cacao]